MPAFRRSSSPGSEEGDGVEPKRDLNMGAKLPVYLELQRNPRLWLNLFRRTAPLYRSAQYIEYWLGNNWLRELNPGNHLQDRIHQRSFLQERHHHLRRRPVLLQKVHSFDGDLHVALVVVDYVLAF